MLFVAFTQFMFGQLLHMCCAYLHNFWLTIYGPLTLVNYLTGVRTLHLLTNFPPPDMKDFEVKIMVRELRRTLKHAVKQASPITPINFSTDSCCVKHEEEG